MPCPFTGHKMFYAGPNFLCPSKIYLHIVPVTNILCQTKRWFAFSKIVFCAGTKVFEEALNAVKFLGWLKKFRPAQNILRPVKGQGISEFWIISHFGGHFQAVQKVTKYLSSLCALGVARVALKLWMLIEFGKTTVSYHFISESLECCHFGSRDR